MPQSLTPSTRGSTLLHPRYRNLLRHYPGNTGINPLRDSIKGYSGPLPRERGNQPWIDAVLAQAEAIAPKERGSIPMP